MILAIFLVSLLAVSVVSAADNTTDDVVSVDQTNEEIVDFCDSDANDTVAASDDNQVELSQDSINDVIEDDNLKSNVNDELINAFPKRFSNLDYYINSNSDKDVYLKYDFIFDSSYVQDSHFKEGITINRDVTIHGNGHTIDGDNLARIFIARGKSVTFKDIIFVNANSPNDGGGAILSYAETCTAINCTFNSNFARNGGAIYNCYAVNCTFNSNSAIHHGGAFCLGEAVNCTFNSNSAGWQGGAMRSGKAVNCTFNHNSASSGYGGAIYEGSAVNCTFNHNAASDGGAMYHGSAVNCTFNYNSAKEGGAACQGSVGNCNFIKNTATEYGGAIYNSTATYCFFENNNAGIAGNDEYNSALVKNPSILTASAVNTVYNGGKYLVATLKDSDGKPLADIKVTIKLSNGKTYNPTTDKNGQVKLTTNGLVPKTYTATIIAENINYAKSTKSVKVTVTKPTPKLTAKAKTFKKSVKTKKYSITLKDNRNKAISKAAVTIKIKGKTYKASTNAKGVATFKIKKLTKKGTFKSTVKYAGNAYYRAVTKTVKIKIK